MLNEMPSVGLLGRSFDVLELPLLDVEEGRNRFIQEIRPVTIKCFGQDIKRADFICIKPETYSLFFHITV